MQRVIPYIGTLERVSNLDTNQAKTLVYYSILTWCPNPPYKPLIDLNGETSTGKNETMRTMKPWCAKSKWIVASEKSSTALRNELANSGTAFVEEFDKVKEPQACERWLSARYNPTSKEVSYAQQKTNEQQKGKGNFNEWVIANHFGYTVIHTQNEIQAVELDRRIIRIRIEKDSSRNYEKAKQQPQLGWAVLKQIAQEVDWDADIPNARGGSAWDCWLPLMRVASHLGDTEFLQFAEEQIQIKVEEDDLSKVFEPKGVVLSEIIPFYQGALDNGSNAIPITSITIKANDREIAGFHPDERQVTKIAKVLGFEVYYPHNKAHIRVVSQRQLDSIMRKHGLNDTSEEVKTLLKSLRLSG